MHRFYIVLIAVFSINYTAISQTIEPSATIHKNSLQIEIESLNGIEGNSVKIFAKNTPFLTKYSFPKTYLLQNKKEKITDIIPLELEDCVFQLQEYFESKRRSKHVACFNKAQSL